MSKSSKRRNRLAERRAMSKLQNQLIVDEAVEPTAQILSAITSTKVESYSGPIPAPEALAKYDEIVPGSAAQIIEWANRQAIHRQDLEQFAVRSEVRRSWWGLVLGFVIAMSAVGGGVVCILYGHDIAGASLVGTSLVGLVTSFVVGTVSRRSERQNRNRVLSGEQTRRSRKR